MRFVSNAKARWKANLHWKAFEAVVMAAISVKPEINLVTSSLVGLLADAFMMRG